MKIITETKIRVTVAELCSRANIILRSDVLSALRKALVFETDVRAKKVLHAIILNAQDARRKKLAICQDTGMPFVLVEIGSGVRIRGDVRAAI
ncbi:MAG: fumarate hydratase, partial [Candidatus Omnitrophica bacterium]|nr:fumarate hydratase [Candidatus Omnitrophota bacterium]